MKLLSPAKLNLFLKVVSKRADGFHEIVSLIQAVNLTDKLTFIFSKQDRITCTNPQIPTDDKNLVWKARELFRKKTALKNCITIHIEKNIPVEGGLGGGSGNAATTLFALNRLYNYPVTEKELQLWSSELGSDVPFFFSSGTAHCTGRGEIVENLKPFDQLKRVWILKPPFGISTKEVYQKWSSQNETHSKDLLQKWRGGELALYNDLEVAATIVEPRVKQIGQQLIDLGYNRWLMTGSGSCMFCIGSGQKPEIPQINAFEVSTINREENKWYT